MISGEGISTHNPYTTYSHIPYEEAVSWGHLPGKLPYKGLGFWGLGFKA